jgi:membrane protein DedA with SNARE-associated domain
VIGVRFMYGLRIAGPVALGMRRIGWLRFAGFNFLGAALWAPLFVGLGYLFGDALERVLGELHRIEHSAFAILTLAGVAAWLGVRRYRRGTGT